MKILNIMDGIKAAFFSGDDNDAKKASSKDADKKAHKDDSNDKIKEEVKEAKSGTAPSDKADGKKHGLTISFADLKKKHDMHVFDFDKIIPDGQEIQDINAAKIDYSFVFDKANIKPLKNKWDIDHVVELVDSFKKEGMGSEQIKKTLFGLLKTDKVSVEAILDDVSERDAAIDTFEEFITNRITKREEALNDKKLDLLGEIAKTDKQIAEEKEYLTRWLTGKQELEATIVDACTYLGFAHAMTVGLVTQGAEGKSKYAKE